MGAKSSRSFLRWFIYSFITVGARNQNFTLLAVGQLLICVGLNYLIIGVGEGKTYAALLAMWGGVRQEAVTHSVVP
jgi:hypothetical protein